MRTGNVSHSGPLRRIQPLGLLTCDPIFRPIRGRLLLRPTSSPRRGSLGPGADARLAIEVLGAPAEGIMVSDRGR